MDLSLFYLPTWREGYGMSLTRYYEELTESVKLADSLGWARAMTTEHHFHYYGGALPIWNAASNSKDSFINAADQGFRLMMNHYPMSAEAVKEKFAWYCERWESAGRKTADRKGMIAFMAHIADTEEQAIEEAKAALQEHAGAFGKVMRGQQWDRDYEGDISVLLHMCEDDDWRDVFRRRTLICSPEQAAERIQRYLDMGFTEISFITRYAGLTNEQNMTTIRRISEEVLPMLGPSANAAA
jgi:alkanesulfonate monooxygenase SsuD/methylene tetrahydromethanopterin reductase-like flavin-dependent oxidoreductase (luciferase family)